MASRVIDTTAELDLDPREAPELPPYRGLLLADPTHFDVVYVINPHMAGNVGHIDRPRARAQWHALKAVYEDLGLELDVLPAAPGMPDLVFSANQSFPALIDGQPAAVLSRMASASRRVEVPLFERWYRAHGVAVHPLAPDLPEEALFFEGTGDATWWPGRRVIVGAWGFRTSPEAWPLLSTLLDAPVLRLALVDPRFYHLDTCLQFLDDRTALFVPEAFHPTALDLLRATVPRLLPVPLHEALDRLACNGFCPDGQHYVVQSGAARTNAIVRRAGFEVVEVETGEFLKSGGSVYCMKLQRW